MGQEFPLVEIDLCFNGKIFHDAPFTKLPNIVVPEDSELVLALDPSSTQIGIALGTMDKELLLFIDFKNVTCFLDEYKGYLNDYLSRLSERYPISKLVYEVPFKQSGDVASDVLHNLEMNFRQYQKVIKDLKKSNMYPMLPGVWRKSFLEDKRYAGRKRKRELLKEATREECSLRYPEYSEYFNSTKYVPDSTDAIGIYNGFLDEYWYDKDKKIKKVSKINSRYSRNHNYTYSIVCDYLNKVISCAVSTCIDRTIDLYAYNKEFNTQENCEIVTSQTNSVCVLLALDELSNALLKWESNIDQEPEYVYAVICYRRRKIDG